MTDLPADSPRRVCLMLTDHLGDVILFSGAWEHLRARFPQWLNGASIENHPVRVTAETRWTLEVDK